MKELSFFPKICLSKLDKLAINYSITEEEKYFCTVKVNEQDYDEVYKIGWQGHLELLNKGSEEDE